MSENEREAGAGEPPVTPSEDTLTMQDIEGSLELVEVYTTDNDMAARTVIDEILGPAGIPAYPHDRRSHAIPAPASLPGEIGIAVPAEMAGRAEELLREARRDGVLSDDGHMMEEELA